MITKLSNIKSFNEFKPVKKKWSTLNRLYIDGYIKSRFFSKKSYFELMIVFTVLKKAIIDIQMISGDLSTSDERLNIDFRIGDHIDKAKEWVIKNGHNINNEIIKF
jgi:hypothetical protein